MNRCRAMFGWAVLTLAAAGANAQYPGYASPTTGGYGWSGGNFGGTSGFGTPGGMSGVNSSIYAPNFYNRASQPLSPYLNLLRGGNAAVNYFYGVRPGLPSGQPIGMGFGTQYTGMSQLRSGFVPYIAGNPSDEPIEVPPVGPAQKMPPSAHPVMYGNRFGPNTGSSMGGAGRNRPAQFGSQTPGQQGGGGQQPGQNQGQGTGQRIPPSK